jgi:hypothetical protein
MAKFQRLSVGFSVLIVILSLSVKAIDDSELAFPGAEGFGALSRGGKGGRVLTVTSLEDSTQAPAEGTLRWAVQQKGPRIVKFGVAGTIALKDTLVIKEPFITIDGSDAPGDGVCLRDHSLNLKDTHDVIVRYIRIRRGDVATLKSIKEKSVSRPKGSSGLDTVSMDDSKDIIFDHVSLSWSNDEIFGIVGCENVTIQWCIISEPLTNPHIHPYGDNHAFGLNLSANTLTLHHCLLAHYVMRGPQFEANDVRPRMQYNVQMEAINNVMFDYERSGSRYTTGIENRPEDAAGKQFQFQFINNYYLNPNGRRPELEAVLKHGVIEPLKVYFSGNLGPHRTNDAADQYAGVFTEEKQNIRNAGAALLAQMSDKKLFTPRVPVTVESAEEAYRKVLEQAGCNTKRDSVDRRIISDVTQRKFTGPVKSQDAVGGWPELK